jgi:hypothetical protein
VGDITLVSQAITAATVNASTIVSTTGQASQDYWLWVDDWPAAATNTAHVQKSGGSGISTLIPSGTNPNQYGDDNRTIEWGPDGDPTASGSHQAGVYYIMDSGDYVDIPLAAGVGWRELRFYSSIYATQGRYTLSLSDSSASPVSTSLGVDGYESRLIVFRYRANSAGQVATLRFEAISNFGGNISSQLIWLSVEESAGGSPAELVGVATSVNTAAGALSAAIKFGAAAVNQVFVTGNLTNGIRFGANPTGNANAAGAMTTQIRVNGVAIDVVSATGAMTNQIRLGTAAASNAAANAGLTNQIKLAGNAIDTATASANLSTGSGGAIAGNAQANAGSSAVLSTQIKLNGNAIVESIATAALNSGVLMSANAQDIATAAAQMTTQIKLAGAAQNTVVATVQMTTQIKYVGTAASIAAAAASLSGSATGFEGNAANIVSVTAALSTADALSGNAQSLVTMTVDMTTEIPVTVAALSNALASGTMSTGIRLMGFAANDADANGTLTNAALVTPYFISSDSAKVVSINHQFKKLTNIECGVKRAA